MKAVRDAIELRVRDAGLRAALESAVAAVEGLHDVPDSLPQIPVHETGGSTRLGWYRVTAAGAPFDILVSRDADDTAFTFLHELGHFLDHQALGASPGTWASSAELADWRDAVEASEAVAALRDYRANAPARFVSSVGLEVELDADDLDYLLEPQELFARSYAQYVATRATDEMLSRQLRAAQAVVYPEAWQETDFEPIAIALDRLLEALGWSGS